MYVNLVAYSVHVRRPGYIRSPLPGVYNSVVYIQSDDNDRVTSANCNKEVLGRALKLITHYR